MKTKKEIKVPKSYEEYLMLSEKEKADLLRQETKKEIKMPENIEEERDALKGRVIELECALKWWLGERMKLFSEDQYGKRQMRRILENGSMPVIVLGTEEQNAN